jgi:hypothetical protein
MLGRARAKRSLKGRTVFRALVTSSSWLSANKTSGRNLRSPATNLSILTIWRQSFFGPLVFEWALSDAS